MVIDEVGTRMKTTEERFCHFIYFQLNDPHAFPGTGEYFSSGNDLSNAVDPPEGETPLNYSAFVTALIEHKKVRGRREAIVGT